MSWYQRIQQAKVGGGGIPPAPGDYIFQVLEVREHNGQGGGAFFIIVLMVLQSSHPDHPPGSQRSQVIRLDVEFKDSPLGDIKGFAAAVLGLDPRDPRVDQEITPQIIAGILHPSQPVAGHVLAANVWLKMPGKRSRPGAQPFTKFTWKPILENGVPKRLPMPQGYVPQQFQQAQQPQAPAGGFGGGYPQPQTPSFGGGQFGGAPPAQAQGYQGQPYNPPQPVQPAQPQGFQGGYSPPAQPAQPTQLPYHAQAGMMGQGYHPSMQAPAPAQPAHQLPQFGGAAAQAPAQPAPAMNFPWQAGAPQAPQAPTPPQFPPAGWQAHPDPSAKGWWWDGKPNGRVLSESDLRTLMAAGQA